MKRLLRFVVPILIGVSIGFWAATSGKFTLNLKPGVSTTAQQAQVGADGALIIGDFESQSDVNRWEMKGTSLEQSTLYATKNNYAGKITFLAGSTAPSIVLSKAFRARQLPTDWSGYERLVFDVFNTEARNVRLIVQLKDEDGKRFKTNTTVPAGEAKTISINMAAAKASINIRDIIHINMFQWKPSKDSTLYIDNMQLVPRGVSVSSDAAGSTEVPVDEAIDLEPIRQGIAEAEKITANIFQARLGNWKSPGSKIVQVPLVVRETAGVGRHGWLASGGVPFAPGELSSAEGVRVVDTRGMPQVAQLRPLAKWHDGSVKWLLVHVQADLKPQEERRYVLEYGGNTPSTSPATSLDVSEDARNITVVTGPMRFMVSKERFTLFEQVWLDSNRDGNFASDEQIAQPGTFVLVHNGRRYESRNDTQTYSLEIEDQGPLSVTLKASGWFRDERGEGFGKFVMRIQAFKGQQTVKLSPTVIYTGYPANRYHHAYEGLKMPENETIQEISLVLPVNLEGTLSGRIGDERGVFGGELNAPLALFQQSHERYELRGTASGTQVGVRASGWATLQDKKHGVTVAVRDFWQQFPKALTLDPQGKRLEISLWPASAGELDLQTTSKAYGLDAVARGSAFGLAKTHELVVNFHSADIDEVSLHQFAAAVQEPVHLRASAEWVNDTGVLGRLAANETHRQLKDELLLERLFNWGARQRDRYAWYGMLNFGDTLSWYRKEGYDKSYSHWDWHPEGRWGWFNCEGAGTHTGALLQYLRTGQWKYFQFGEDLVRHIMDVDTVHYDTAANDPRLKDVIPEDFSRVGSMHRHNADHWGGRNDEASHTSVVGILLYYYLTGDPRAHDVALEVGEFFLGEHMTYVGHPDIAPQRTLGNVLWGDTWLYELTGDEMYLRSAAKWAKRFVDGQRENGVWLETYDPLSRKWRGKENTAFMASYTLPALIAYHRLTNQPEVARAIIEGTRYMIHHQQFYPFFDALAYSFDLTGDEQFLSEGEARIAKLAAGQDVSGDPDQDGSVSDKLTYGRVAPFLYSTPYLFDTLEKRTAYRRMAKPVPLFSSIDAVETESSVK